MKPLAASAFKAIPGKSYATPKELWGFRSERGRGTPRSIAWHPRGQPRAPRHHLRPRSPRPAPRDPRPRRGSRHLPADLAPPPHSPRLRHRAHRPRSARLPREEPRGARRHPAPDPRAHAPPAPRGAPRPRRGRPRPGQRARGGAAGAPVVPSRRLLHPAWRVRVHRSQPRAEVIVYVHAITGRIISRVDNLAEATGKSNRLPAQSHGARLRISTLGPNGRVQRPSKTRMSR